MFIIPLAILMLDFVLAQAPANKLATKDPADRLLYAGMPHIKRRSNKVCAHREFDLDFYEATSDSKQSLSATMKVSSQAPTFLLEDIDHMLDYIQCRQGEMEIKFLSPELQAEFQAQVEEVDAFRIVTSHTSCNEHGGRLPYQVGSYSFDGGLAIFKTESLEWNDFSYSLKFGSVAHSYHLIHPSRLQRRQEESKTQTSTSHAPRPTLIPLDGDDELSTLSFSFNQSLIDFQLLPIDTNNSAVDTVIEFLNPFPLPEGLTFSCKNCTFRGDFDIFEGGFEINSKDRNFFEAIEDVGDAITNDFNDAFVQIVSNELFAHIEFELAWEDATVIQRAIDLSLFTVPVASIGIPGIVTIGPKFEAQVVLEAAVDHDLQITYGFELNVPKNATAVAHFGRDSNFNQSSSVGFNETSFKELPFQSKLENTTLTLSAAFKPRLHLSVELDAKIFDAGISTGISFDLPKYTVSFAPQQGLIDENCTAILNRTATDAEKVLQDIGNFTQIKSEYEVGLNFEFILEPLVGQNTTTFAWAPLATTVPAATACVALVSGELVPATALASSISSKLAAEASRSLEILAASKTFSVEGGTGVFSGSTGTPSDSAASSTSSSNQNMFKLRSMVVGLAIVASCALLL